MNFNHGTISMGFKYQGDVVLAVDSRANSGMSIDSGSVKKIIKINKLLLGTIYHAGGAAGSMSCETEENQCCCCQQSVVRGCDGCWV